MSDDLRHYMLVLQVDSKKVFTVEYINSYTQLEIKVFSEADGDATSIIEYVAPTALCNKDIHLGKHNPCTFTERYYVIENFEDSIDE